MFVSIHNIKLQLLPLFDTQRGYSKNETYVSPIKVYIKIILIDNDRSRTTIFEFARLLNFNTLKLNSKQSFIFWLNHILF